MRCPIAPASRPQALVPTSNTLSSIVGVSVPPNKAIVGANAFAHEAGIHQDGMLKHELTYEIMRPESVGAPGTRLVLGKHSGMRGLDARCRALGHRLRQPELERLYVRVTALADRTKTVDDEQLTAIIREELAAALAVGAAPATGRGDVDMSLKIALLPGDGIGPEVTEEAVRILKNVARAFRQDVLVLDASDRRRRDRCRRRRPARARRSKRPRTRMRCCSAPSAIRSSTAGCRRSVPEAALLALRQALGGFANLRPAIYYPSLAKRTAVPARARARRQPADRPRAARRPVFRRAARLRSLGQHRVQHADLFAPRDRARGQGRVRARARAPQEGRVDRQGQRPRDVAAVARGRVGSGEGAIPTSSSSTSTSTRRRCAWRPRRPAST